MKLLLRLSKPVKRTVTVTVPTVEGCQTRLKDLQLLAAQTLGLKVEDEESGSVNIKFSLNNKDILSGDSVSLSDLGIVNGDLIYVHVGEEMTSAGRGQSSSQQQVTENKCDKIDTDLEPSPAKQCSSLESRESVLPPSAKYVKSNNFSSSVLGRDMNADGLTDMETNESSDFLKPVLFIGQSSADDIPESLRIVLEAVQPVTEQQILFSVLHVLVLEIGFTLQHSENDLPKQEEMNRLKLTYRFRRPTDNGFCLIAVPMASKLLVHALSVDANKVRFTLALKPTEYVTLSDNGPKFKNLHQLSKQVKAKLLYPMLQHITGEKLNFEDLDRMYYDCDLALSGPEHLSTGDVNKYLNQAILVRESKDDDLPQSLINVLQRAKPRTEHEALFLVIHVLVLETGFVFQNPGSELLPKQQPVSQFKLIYHCREEKEKRFSLIAVAMANRLVVHAISQDEEAVRYSTVLKPEEYVTFDNGLKFKRLAQLSREVKDKVSYPMLQYLANETGYSVPSLTGLLYEVKIQILKCLDAPSLLRLSETCYLYSVLCKSQFLWRRLFIKDFGRSSLFMAAEKEAETDWFELYKKQYVKRKEMREHFRSLWPARPYKGHIPGVYPPFGGRLRWGPPYLLRGDYDRLPGGLFLPHMGSAAIAVGEVSFQRALGPHSLQRSRSNLATLHRQPGRDGMSGRPSGFGRFGFM